MSTVRAQIHGFRLFSFHYFHFILILRRIRSGLGVLQCGFQITLDNSTGKNETSFYHRFVLKTQLFKVFARKDDFKMLLKHDLPKSMAWRIIGRLVYKQTQRKVAESVEMARNIASGLWNRFRVTEY